MPAGTAINHGSWRVGRARGRVQGQEIERVFPVPPPIQRSVERSLAERLPAQEQKRVVSAALPRDYVRPHGGLLQLDAGTLSRFQHGRSGLCDGTTCTLACAQIQMVVLQIKMDFVWIHLDFV